MGEEDPNIWLFGHLSIKIAIETENGKKLVDQIMSFNEQFL